MSQFGRKPRDCKEISDLTTHRGIWDLLRQAQSQNYLTVDSMHMLIYFREASYDIFCILDDDFDVKLRKVRLEAKFIGEQVSDMTLRTGDIHNNRFNQMKNKIESDFSKK